MDMGMGHIRIPMLWIDKTTSDPDPWPDENPSKHCDPRPTFPPKQ